ncbi:winged helix-turn-helix domain-containing protein [Legionella gresilensis]|uniref:winged helix-turn-helix domain-containing protein n=1 Tax=Legionella gresilensis TaxID=91823 RepID=UPI00104105A4|nr:winged helix-turn-helix domain-containing protein [Legionella gresilensis]
MLLHRKYIIIIDDAPKDIQVEEYFHKYDYQILHYNSVPDLNTIMEKPAAFLIHSSMLAEIKLSTINDFYQWAVPLIVLNDEKDETLCVQMLEEGADDFLIKPILARELHARIGAINRRVQRSLTEDDQEREVLAFENWRLYPASRQVFGTNHQELQLSAGEYDLLLAFVRQPQQILGREFLLQVTKSSDLNPFDRRIDVQISRLRQKIETDTKKPALIKTIRNGGYLFTAQVFTMKEGPNSYFKGE